MLEMTPMTDKYRGWIEAVSAQFGGLDLCALEVLVARDGREIIMELNDCALPLLGDSQEEDRRLISELVLHRMNVSHVFPMYKGSGEISIQRQQDTVDFFPLFVLFSCRVNQVFSVCLLFLLTNRYITRGEMRTCTTPKTELDSRFITQHSSRERSNSCEKLGKHEKHSNDLGCNRRGPPPTLLGITCGPCFANRIFPFPEFRGKITSAMCVTTVALLLADYLRLLIVCNWTILL